MKIDISSYTFYLNFMTIKKNIKLIVKNAELAGVYAFIIVLTGLFFRISWAILSGQKISLKEIGDFSSLVYLFIASFFLTFMFVSKIPGVIYILDIIFGASLYISILSLPISLIIRDHSISNILKNLVVILLLAFYLVDIKEDTKPKRPSKFRAKPPRGYNPT
ncbi:hypothetical protein [Thermococcus sp. GR6]|uniref:hypothetical protein n=1 Tax=Thermococcus sp. GR6 TaxID=1638256 RepID=UPI00142F80B9|nr:hypothetical protein [Thermococcus sp. GR6]NJE41803.1 hypothetical protein [Thermococcus sp. GR6]